MQISAPSRAPGVTGRKIAMIIKMISFTSRGLSDLATAAHGRLVTDAEPGTQACLSSALLERSKNRRPLKGIEANYGARRDLIIAVLREGAVDVVARLGRSRESNKASRVRLRQKALLRCVGAERRNVESAAPPPPKLAIACTSCAVEPALPVDAVGGSAAK